MREGVNNKIKVIKRKACRSQDLRCFTLKIYMVSETAMNKTCN
jgi:hypothetical protein